MDKKCFALQENIRLFIDTVGIDSIGFLTLTFEDNVTCAIEALRRFKVLYVMFLSVYFGGYILVKEKQKRGAWHYHLIIDCRGDIRSGTEWKGKVLRNRNPFLSKLRTDLREACPKYGFGRHELMPIRKDAESCAGYLAKYVSKKFRQRVAGQRVRLFSYSRVAVRFSPRLTWFNDKCSQLRHDAGRIAKKFFNADNQRDMYESLGRGWGRILFSLAWLMREVYNVKKFNQFCTHGNYADYTLIDGQLACLVTGEIFF